MKLIQLNIWGGKLLYQLRDFINQEQPDILCMQEVHDLTGPSGAIFVTLDEIQQYCGYAYRYMSPTYTSNYQQRQNSYGNAILSKFPIDFKETIFTAGAFKNDFDLTVDDFNVRNLQHITIDYNGVALHIFNHHGWLVAGSKLGNVETLRQMHTILDEIHKVAGAVVMTGDFNLSPQSQSIRLFADDLHNLSVGHDLRSTYTQLNIHEEVCDYIFVNDAVKVTDFTVSDSLVSDHKPLILDFSL